MIIYRAIAHLVGPRVEAGSRQYRSDRRQSLITWCHQTWRTLVYRLPTINASGHGNPGADGTLTHLSLHENMLGTRGIGTALAGRNPGPTRNRLTSLHGCMIVALADSDNCRATRRPRCQRKSVGWCLGGFRSQPPTWSPAAVGARL
jgi:hypothetical protein